MSSLVHSADCIGSIPGELVARLEAASVGSRELDALIWKALHPRGEIAMRGAGRPGLIAWRCRVPGATVQNAWTNPGAYTTSLDAALALAERVLPGWDYCVSQGHGEAATAAWSPADSVSEFCATAATPALAACIAILKATDSGKAGLAGYEAEGVVNPKNPSPEKQGEGL